MKLEAFNSCVLTGFRGGGGGKEAYTSVQVTSGKGGVGGYKQQFTVINSLSYAIFLLNNKSHTHAIIRSSSPSSKKKEVFANWQNQILHKCERGDW